MEIKIEKGIPVPPKIRSTGIAKVLSEMEIGDSFILPYGDKRYRSIHQVAISRGIKVKVRRQGEVFRIWRIA